MYLLSHNPRFVYLHGFASSPKSRKATYFADRFQSLGLPLTVPDLAQGDFHHLTISGQLKLLENITGDEPAILIGSSLGAYLAALHAARNPLIQKIVLLAPAFDFYRLWKQELGPERLADWQQTGALPVFHYGEQRELPLCYSFLADAARFEPFPAVQQPALLFHGDEDRVVPVEKAVVFAKMHSHAELVRLASGHELTDVLDTIWQRTSGYLFDPAALTANR